MGGFVVNRFSSSSSIQRSLGCSGNLIWKRMCPSHHHFLQRCRLRKEESSLVVGLGFHHYVLKCAVSTSSSANAMLPLSSSSSVLKCAASTSSSTTNVLLPFDSSSSSSSASTAADDDDEDVEDNSAVSKLKTDESPLPNDDCFRRRTAVDDADEMFSFASSKGRPPPTCSFSSSTISSNGHLSENTATIISILADNENNEPQSRGQNQSDSSAATADFINNLTHQDDDGKKKALTTNFTTGGVFCAKMSDQEEEVEEENQMNEFEEGTSLSSNEHNSLPVVNKTKTKETETDESKSLPHSVDQYWKINYQADDAWEDIRMVALERNDPMGVTGLKDEHCEIGPLTTESESMMTKTADPMISIDVESIRAADHFDGDVERMIRMEYDLFRRFACLRTHCLPITTEFVDKLLKYPNSRKIRLDLIKAELIRRYKLEHSVGIRSRNDIVEMKSNRKNLTSGLMNPDSRYSGNILQFNRNPRLQDQISGKHLRRAVWSAPTVCIDCGFLRHQDSVLNDRIVSQLKQLVTVNAELYHPMNLKFTGMPAFDDGSEAAEVFEESAEAGQIQENRLRKFRRRMKGNMVDLSAVDNSLSTVDETNVDTTNDEDDEAAFRRFLARFSSRLIHLESTCYMDQFPRDRIIMLSPDARDTLPDRIDPDKVYVFGAVYEEGCRGSILPVLSCNEGSSSSRVNIWSHSHSHSIHDDGRRRRQKPEGTLEKARRLGIEVRRLPVDRYARWTSESPNLGMLNLVLSLQILADAFIHGSMRSAVIRHVDPVLRGIKPTNPADVSRAVKALNRIERRVDDENRIHLEQFVVQGLLDVCNRPVDLASCC